MTARKTPLPTPARFIRESVFGIHNQKAFGDLIGYSQAHICRFENGTRDLSRAAQERIRAAAKRKRIVFDSNWFFEVPTSTERRVA